jgi:acetyltransferase-like isoleucine patch superfamily enzyme
VGDRVYINANLTVLAHAPVRIGDDVIIAPNVSLFSVGHDPDLSGAACRHSRVHGSIEIQSGVWIGGNCIILPGVTIGENSVIGAGSVVSKSIPANVIAVGNPCRVIRQKKSPAAAL